jgi:hypothetical protein
VDVSSGTNWRIAAESLTYPLIIAQRGDDFFVPNILWMPCAKLMSLAQGIEFDIHLPKDKTKWSFMMVTLIALLQGVGWWVSHINRTALSIFA